MDQEFVALLTQNGAEVVVRALEKYYRQLSDQLSDHDNKGRVYSAIYDEMEDIAHLIELIELLPQFQRVV